MISRLLNVLKADKVLSEDQMVAGLSKINPKLKGFFNLVEKNNLPIAGALSFLNTEFRPRKRLPKEGDRVHTTAISQSEAEEESRIQRPSSLGKATFGTILGSAALGALGRTGAALATTAAVPGVIGDQLPSSTAQEPLEDEPMQQTISNFEDFMRKDRILGQEIQDRVMKGEDPNAIETFLIGNKRFSPRVEKMMPFLGNIGLGQFIYDTLVRPFQEPNVQMDEVSMVTDPGNDQLQSLLSNLMNRLDQ